MTVMVLMMLHGSVKSSDSRLRRGCVTDGHEITDNTEAKPKAGQLTGNMGTGSSINTDTESPYTTHLQAVSMWARDQKTFKISF